jgi:STAM-binding protein
MSTPDQSSRPCHNQRRPPTVAELSERALENLHDESRPLKYFLSIADKYRKDAREYYSKGDLEDAFILFARAATLVLDRLPAHREYYTLLTRAQRRNLLLVSIFLQSFLQSTLRYNLFSTFLLSGMPHIVGR